MLPSRLKNQVDLFPSLRGNMSHPTLLEKPEGSKIIVLSPHSDDDIWACGGALYKHHLAGDHIITVYMTDGRKGGNGSEPEEQLILERQKEAQKAADIIGINKLIFMDNEDSKLEPNKKTISLLIELLRDFKPDIVYVPFLIDFHPDHIATSDILVEVIKAYRDFTCYGYEVWTPMLPNCFVDVTEHIGIKESALSQFKTQTGRFNLIGASMGLSKYRSVVSCGHGDRFVECFFRCSPAEYTRLSKLIT